MQTLIVKLFMLLAAISCWLGLPVSAPAFLWGDSPLVTINGNDFSGDDYFNWWREWREEDLPTPESPDDFIDWMLLAQEAQAMQLDQNADYRKKLAVFLKVRSLMQLKQDEVSVHTRMPDDKSLWDAYRKEHTPLFNLHMLTVDSEEQAAVVKRFLDSGQGLSAAVVAAGLAKTAEELAASGPLRARQIPQPLRQAIQDLPVGGIAGPVTFGHVWYFLEVLERDEGHEADFARFKDELIRDDLKRQENELTFQLVERLKQKYAVKIDDELIGRITPEGFPEEEAEDVAMQVADTKISVRGMYQVLAKEHKLRGSSQRNAESFDQTRKRVVNDIVVQTLTGLEATNRHYEESPPLKETYDFYRRHRLIKELEKALILPAVKVDDGAVAAYYKAHPEDFSREGLVELAIVETKEIALAKQLEKQLKAGGEFFQVLHPLAPAGIETRRVPVDHLPPAVGQALKTMSPGQSSGALEDGETLYFIKLIREGEREFIPLESIRTDLRPVAGSPVQRRAGAAA